MAGIITQLYFWFIVFSCFIFIRSNVAYHNQRKIIDAIYAYTIKSNYISDVDYDDMESYEKTMLRFWDFGCKRILPKDMYEKISPYIK